MIRWITSIRYHPRFFDQVWHQTASAYIKNKHFFTKSCHCQTCQNYEQPPQSLQNLYFQSHYLASKINLIILIFFCAYYLDTIQDFLIKLCINPLMHLLEIDIFSIYHVIIRPTKIMNNLIKNCKIRIFQHQKSTESY